jgi:outer membrane translocation and assembly module TamA
MNRASSACDLTPWPPLLKERGNEEYEPLSFRRGVGVFGVRWRSPIGPIRADVAWALSEQGRPIRFYLNIGPDL